MPYHLYIISIAKSLTSVSSNELRGGEALGGAPQTMGAVRDVLVQADVVDFHLCGQVLAAFQAVGESALAF